MNREDPASALRRLPPPATLDARIEERIRLRARAALEAQVALRDRPLAARLLARVVMPALAAATVCLYLHWAVRAAAALYR